MLQASVHWRRSCGWPTTKVLPPWPSSPIARPRPFALESSAKRCPSPLQRCNCPMSGGQIRKELNEERHHRNVQKDQQEVHMLTSLFRASLAAATLVVMAIVTTSVHA